ncbi:MAG: cysteine desulfurase [Treponema sp.]|jgi:cysteine desulfurase|nr:cysteine desulfurase [Treponema sp.]
MKVYADHAATTPLDPRVLEAMLPFLGQRYYNPSSLYPEAKAVRAEVEAARRTVLELIGGPGRIVFTGSGTESVNLALRSAVSECDGDRKRILVSAVEHHAVLGCADSLAREGFAVECLPVDRYGVVSPDELKVRMGPDVSLVSVMSANNETGAVNDSAALCKIAHNGGAFFHTDAVQALGVFRIRAEEAGADFISVSAHKIYGPKGVGAMYAAENAPVFPVIRGGEQEGGARAGTENVAGIIGFGRAAGILNECLEEDALHLGKLKRIFLDGIESIPDVIVNSPPGGAPHIVSVSAAGVEAELCLLRLSMAGVFASMGAACNSSSVEPSHVVEAVGVPAEYKRGTMRFSFGRDNTAEDVSFAARELALAVAKSR